MSEEFVTKSIMLFLQKLSWEILDYDFPGSGTGRGFHLSHDGTSKNRGLIIPDIIAYKDGVFLFVESKNRDSQCDYKKIKTLFEQRQEIEKQLATAYGRNVFTAIIFAIAHGGDNKFLKIAEENKVNCIFQEVSPYPHSDVVVLYDNTHLFIE